jgi:hypothetical protein
MDDYWGSHKNLERRLFKEVASPREDLEIYRPSEMAFPSILNTSL